MKISLFLVGTKECKFFSKLSSIIQNNNPISYNPHITLATLNLSKNKNQDIETIIKLSKELATEIQSEHFDVKLNSKISLGTQFFQSIFLECDPSNQTLQKARRISENKFKPFLQEGLFYPHVSLYYGKEDENKKRALNRIENNNFSNFVFRTTAIQLTLYDSSKDHSEWISLGRINLHTPNIFLPQANYVDGRYYRSVDAKNKVEQQMDVFNPANGKVIVEVPNSSANDVNVAIKAAQNAFSTWGKTTGAYRAEFIRKIAALINEHLEDLALLESLDNGKPLGEAREDISACAKQMDYYANLAIDLDKRQDQRVESSDDFLDCRVRYEPIGVCALICPFNYPLMIAIWKLSGCLAAGCTAVIKPSEVTPLSILHLARLINLAGLPAGVFNVLTGDGVTTGNPLVTSPLVDKVSFTGSYLTGSRIMNNVSQGVKAITLELGGKSSLICFDDVENLEDAIDWMLCSIFWNAGQVCSATSRLLLHRSIKDKVVKRLVEEAQKIKVGYGLAEGTKMGPLVSKGQYEKVKRYIESAVKEGATLLTGGLPDPEEFPEGYFIRPTIFDNVTKSMTVWREEIFGPVLLIQSFDTEEEAVRTANETEYGLAGAVFSKDEERCNRVARNLNVGVTWINCAQPSPKELPWGGCKKSGIGRENGVWGLDAFLSVKQITEWSKKSSDKSFKWFNSKL